MPEELSNMADRPPLDPAEASRAGRSSGKIVALAGGVGGAKLALGLYRYLQSRHEPNRLVVIVNTGDDMEYLGLRISPDLDTVMYTLAGQANTENGWGLKDDHGEAMIMLGEYGLDTWFWLGDRDLGTHLARTQRLRQGQNLTEITEHLRRSLAIECELLPMCNEPVQTMVETQERGELAFQEYFVKRKAADTVTGLRFEGIEEAEITEQVGQALTDPALIVICPSNPYLSIWPILSIPGMRSLLRSCSAPIVVVSPIVGGQALKGPAANIMRTLGQEPEPSALAVARLYAGFAQRFVLDNLDAALQADIEELSFKTLVTDTVMSSEDDKTRLAREILEEFLG